jgi:purine-binding chemotaxis protein CheW
MNYQKHFTEQQLQILNERAARVRYPVENNRTANTMPLVYIWLEQEVYAMPMINLITVHQDITVVPIPCVPAFVAGVANIRGRVMPVIDLARLLNIPTPEQNAASKREAPLLVVVSAETQEVVFRVNRIGDGSIATNADLKPLPDTFSIPYPEFIAGLLPDGTPQLDVPAVLNSPEIVVNDSFENIIR